MERAKNLFQQVYDYDRLLYAYEQAREDEMYSKETPNFSANLEENLINIQNHLMYKSYEVGLCKSPGKEWLIVFLPFSDHIVQWAIYNALSPIFIKPHVASADGCTPEEKYHLIIDTSGCFFQVDHNILLDIIRRKIDDEDMMWLLQKVISFEQNFGLPPVSLTSNLFEEIYLREIDRYAKCELGIRHYQRCSKEISILTDDLYEIERIRNDVGTFFTYNLRLNFVCVLEDKMKI